MKKMVLAWLLVMCLPVYAAVSVRAAPSVMRSTITAQKPVARMMPIQQAKKRETPMAIPPPILLRKTTDCCSKKGCKK